MEIIIDIKLYYYSTEILLIYSYNTIVNINSIQCILGMLCHNKQITSLTF